MPMVSMKMKILILVTFVRISLHFLRPLQRRIILDLHKNLLKWHVQWSVLLIPSERACLLAISILCIFHPSLFWMRASEWHVGFASILSVLFLFLAIIASSAFIKF